ncbi:putative myristoylated membrane protein [Cotonvirus japonicus]|uniref:Myristoylated membrane protein n=1 Tax=Cotonvirus japonicus TaxID=2811091 RepID=A0ABM7NT33_9VIRU|nr:putative myristoylated membrane protein [Cotonvirus japonicus]BCS83261.1 putative myristoylated membrane protein [Cotonvirus japonicus]
MGASVSTNEQAIENNILSKSYNSCGSVGTVNVTDISNLKFYPPPNCDPPSNFDITQASEINSKCLITSLQKNAADVAAKLSADAKAGLGLSASTNVNDIVNNINTITKNKCAGASTTNKASISDTVIKACQFKVIQDATDNVSCQINATQDVVSNIASKAAADAKGGSIFGDLFGGGNLIKIIIGIIVLIAIIGLAFFLYKKLSKKSTGDTSADILAENTGTISDIPANNLTTTKIEAESSGIPITKSTEQGLTGGLMALVGGNSKSFEKFLRTNKLLFILFLLLIVIMIAYIINKNNKCQRQRELEQVLIPVY